MKSVFKKTITAIISALFIGSTATGVAGCMPKSVDMTAPENAYTARQTPPTDGSLPTAYTCAENLAYIVAKFDSQTQYHTESRGITSAAIANQSTNTWRDYKDGVLITTDLTFSSMVKGGTQTCTVFDQKEDGTKEGSVYFRTSATPSADTVPTTAKWSTDAPTLFTEHSYLYTYGLLPTELFNYLVNEETIVSSEEIVCESDGTYTLSFVLNPNTSTFYYQFGMKTRGGLSDFPNFKNIEITVNFDKNWQINSCSVDEVSDINKGIVLKSVSKFNVVYYYGEDHFDEEHFAYYEDYYSKYIGDDNLNQGGSSDEELVMDVTNILSNGFSQIMDGGQQFEISAKLGKNTYVGYIYLSLDLADIANSIRLKLSLGQTLENQDFYVEYGQNGLSCYYGESFALGANMAEVKLAVGEFGDLIDKINNAISSANANNPEEGGASSENTAEGNSSLDGLLETIMNSMVLTSGEKQAVITLDNSLDASGKDKLGLGIDFKVDMIFGISGNTIAIRGVKVEGLSSKDNGSALSLALKTTTAEEISRQPMQNEANLADYIADVHSLLSSDVIKVRAVIDGTADGVCISALKDVKAEVTAYANLDGISLGADATVYYNYKGNDLTASLSVFYEINAQSGKYGNAYLSLNSFNGTALDLKVKCDIAQLAEGVQSLLNMGSAKTGLNTAGLADIISGVLSADFSSLLTEMYADGAEIKIAVSIDTLLDMFNIDAGVKFGSCALSYKRGGANGGNLSVTLPAIGFALNVSGADDEGQLTEPDKDEYLDLDLILEDLNKFINANYIAVGITFDGANFTAVSIPYLASLKANAVAYLNVKNGLTAQVTANVEYENITATITAYYLYDANTYGTVILSLDSLCGVERNVKLYCNVNEVIDGVNTLLTYFGNSATVATSEGTATANAIDLNTIIANLLSADLNALIPELNADSVSANITVNVDEVLNLLNVNAGMTIGNVSLGYNHNGENVLSVSVPSFGVGVMLNPYNEQLEELTCENALNLADVLADVNSIIEAKKLAVALTFDGASLGMDGLCATATVYADLNSGITAQVTATVSYENITATITAYYVYDANTYGRVILSLDSLCGAERNVKLYCNVNEVIDGVNTLLGYFGSAESTEATESANGNAIDLNAILANLLTADINTILTDISAGENLLNLEVNVDEALKLLNVNAGMTIGNVSLTYEHNGENLLSATVPSFGIGVTLNPYNEQLEELTLDNALNLADVLADVNKVLEANKLVLGITFDGDALNVEALKGIKVEANAYFDFADAMASITDSTKALAVQLDATLSFIYNSERISAHIIIRYQGSSMDSGKVVLLLDRINNTEVCVKVGCNIDEVVTGVKTLIEYVTPKTETLASDASAEQNNESVSAVSNILSNLLTADINALIPQLSTTSNTLNLGVDVDNLLNVLGLNTGMALGELTLTYKHLAQNEEGDLLSANLPSLGLALTLNPTDISTQTPADIMTGCFELSDLLNTVNSAMSQINAIKDGQKITFVIDEAQNGGSHGSYLSLDGILIYVWGEGEISWKSGEEYVALDLGMSISETGTDVTTLKLYYNKNAVDTPMVRLALNGIGLDIYKSDIDGVKNGFIEIYNKVASALGMAPISAEPAQPDSTTPTDNATVTDVANSTTLISTDELLTLVFGVLAKDDWVEFLNNFSATCDGTSLLLSYLSDNCANVKIGTDGNLSLEYDGAFGERFSLGGDVKVYAVGGSLISALQAEFDGENIKMSSSKDGDTAFIKLAYDYLFEALDCISVENILGSDTYSVVFELSGDNCNITELAGVYVNAELYITGEKDEFNGKLAEGLLNINAGGVIINLHVITEYQSGQQRFFINLNQVADIKLPDFKVYATQDSLFDTFKVLVSAINNTNVMDMLGGLMGTDSSNSQTSTEGEVVINPETAENTTDAQTTSLASLLEKLINFNFSEAVISTEVDGVVTTDIDLNNLLGQLGITYSGDLGNIKAVINHNDHSMTTNAQAKVIDKDGVESLKTWLSLSSAKTPRRDYSSFDRGEYVSIEFLPDLISDLVKFATDDNGNVYEKFTLSGSITANIVSMFTINIDVSTLTVSMADNDFYFSGLLHVKKMSALGLVTIPESTVGISFHGGYLTLAKGLNTTTPEYRIMTMDYFMDHMLVKADNDCVLKWWLNISGWDTVMSIIKSTAGDLNVSSGLTTPQDVYLYNVTSDKEEQEISMYDFVEALRVVINGTETASFGDISPLENEFGISDNYYGFALNAGKVTGDVLTKLYCALLRDDNGISGVKASGAIQSYVKFSATLNYEEGATTEYVMGNTLTSGVVAPSMYDKANEIISAQGITVDYSHFVKNEASGYDEKFGCFNLYYNSDNSNYDASYNYSNMLYQHTLTIVNLDGTKQTRLVRHGSTVYLYDNNSPAYTDDTKEFRLLYSTVADTVGETSFVMNSDMTVYAVRRTAVSVIVHSGEQLYTLSSFVGDKVPTEVKGLETIGAVTYADGTAVGENEIIEEAGTIDIYGTFVNSEVTINCVKYSFSSDTMSYTVVGRSAGFNAKYCDGSNPATLVLENEIGGYPVTAIAKEALANTDGHAIKRVVVPQNIVTVGERAFLDNIGMELAVFLADSVTFHGEAKSGRSMPFYGCSVLGTEDDVNGKNGNEVTYLNVYYHNIVTTSGDDWRHFRYVSKFINFNFYIGENGGSTHSSGWDYVTASATVELNGVVGSTLSEDAVNTILSKYYPLVSDSTFALSTAIEANLSVDFAQFDMTKNGITYKCVFTPELSTVGGYTHVTYSVSYSLAKIINVYSEYEFTYYGTKIPANTATKVTIPVTGEELVLDTPTEYTHNFASWNIVEENGEEVYKVVWAEKATYSLQIKLKRGGTDTNIVHILENGANEKTYRINGNVIGGTANVTSILLYEGEATFTLNNNKLTIVTGNITYTVFVNDAEVTGSDKGIQRVISSSITGVQTVSGNMTLTFSY
ncbi:MAG: hypothetical protein ACI4MS_07105 [Candidatus Coproplasma sp.]